MKKKFMCFFTSVTFLLLTSSVSLATYIGHTHDASKPTLLKGYMKNWADSKGYVKNWDKFKDYVKDLDKSKVYSRDWTSPKDYSRDWNKCNSAPEPTTMILLGTGLVGLAGSRIRRKKK